ncbi:FGFR1 [Branchiostoma lanceolatum]|uniref:FGFR1 protein n=1 Tax=Branchiostoma lanceolatum TaxID=7740 RepID=A0A8K0EIU5_BRALA|nr:FGFR1 [Branchiostoma lanceolatum]
MALRATFCAALLLAMLLDGRQVSENLFVWDENIEIPEDVSVGSTLVWLRDLLAASGVSSIEIDNGTFWSVNITTGDASGRFGVHDEDLALIVAAPLDFKLHPWYNLTVKLTNTGNNNDLHVTLVIVVLDVSGYPPFYNKRLVVSMTELGSDGGFVSQVLKEQQAWEVDKEDIRFEHMIGEGEFGHVVRGRLRVPEGYEVLVAAKSIRPDRMTASAPQYILVEYASNEELRRYLWSLREQYKTTGNSKLLDRLGFAADVASGLSQLARLKIVHRDIAARNVVISDRKVAKIADFGLSRDVYMSSAYERTNQGGEEELLPLKWMAVESLRDGVYTCESDVWSYGVLLWEIASFGEEPRYAGGPMHPDVCTMLELLKKGVRLQQPENCPMSVYRIIRSCWIVDPLKRPTPDELFRKIDLMRPQRHAAQLVNHNI